MRKPTSGKKSIRAGIALTAVTLLFSLSQFSPAVRAQISPTSGFVKSEPAPMGITDYGVDPFANTPYSYSTTSFQGIITISSLSTSGQNGQSGNEFFELNVNLDITTKNGDPQAYWLQEAAAVSASSVSPTVQTVSYAEELYNFTAPSLSMDSGCVKGGGSVDNTRGTTLNDYGANSVGLDTVSFPTVISLRANSTMTSSGPVIASQYEDAATNGWVTFDTVALTCLSTASDGNFVVEGSTPIPSSVNYLPGTFFSDAELTMGGPGNLAQVKDVQSDVKLQLEFWNGNNYQMVPTAYDFGNNSGESVSNAVAFFTYDSSNGEIFSEITQGPGNPCAACTVGPLYGSNQVGTVVVTAPTVPSGVLSVWTLGSPPSGASRTLFVFGQAKIVIYPGTYCVSVSDATGKTYGPQTVTVSGGATQTVATGSFTGVCGKAFPSITTSLSAATTFVGGAVTDQATISGLVNPDGSGSIVFYTYAVASCPHALTQVEVGSSFPVKANGVYGPSAPTTFSSAGTYYWNAQFDGDSNNYVATSPCETLIVEAAPTITTSLSATTISVGGSVTDAVTVSGTPDPGPFAIALEYFGNGACSGPSTVVSTDTVPSGTTTLPPVTPPAQTAGTYGLEAVLSGGGAASACETFTVMSQVPEFPYQLVTMAVFTVLIVASYLLVRRRGVAG